MRSWFASKRSKLPSFLQEALLPSSNADITIPGSHLIRLTRKKMRLSPAVSNESEDVENEGDAKGKLMSQVDGKD